MSKEKMKDFSLKYFNVLRGTFAGLNLTAIDDFEEFYYKQILDSILPFEKSPIFRTTLDECQLMVDIGFGGGFPILPMAYLRSDYQYIGFESKRKKVEAVTLIKGELGLSSVKLYHHNLEDIFFDRKCLLTFKAVGTCKEFLKKIKSNQELYVYFFKGPRFNDLEGNDVKEIIAKGDWELIEESYMELERTEGRWLVGFKKKNVLHGTDSSRRKGKKLLVNLSEFL